MLRTNSLRISKRKICVVTGTRAEYGLLKSLCFKIRDHKKLKLQLIATGSHLSELHGNTYREIESDGLVIDKKIDLEINDDSPSAVSRSTSLSLRGCSESFETLMPDVVLVLGDRYELLGAAIASLYHGITVAHLHGGEITEGAFDESIRHSLTKLSQLHFVATEAYRRRVIQLGENPGHVFNVGGLGVDAIRQTSLLEKEEVERRLGLSLFEKNILVTFHPETHSLDNSFENFSKILEILGSLTGTLLIITMPNADPGHKRFFNLIQKFVLKNPDSRVVFDSLGQLLYFSLIQYVDCVVGNSSSGLLEVPTFKKATINIGDRQKGRIRAQSVIDCDANPLSIKNAIEEIYSDNFQKMLQVVKNPYGQGGAADSIVNLLATLNPPQKKVFFDV